MATSGADAPDHQGEHEAAPKPPQKRLLVVEDEESLRRTIRRTFRNDYEVFEAEDGAEGLEQALAVEPRVVITDQRMPRLTGVELLSKLKERLPNTIRILITGYDDYGPVVDAVNAAQVHHYFEKPFHYHDLRKVVDTLVRNAELESQRDQLLGELRTSVRKLEETNAALTKKEADLAVLIEERTAELRHSNAELRQLNDQLREMAVRDGLTGLFNHRYLVEHIELEVARSQRYDRAFCVLFLDIDDFKQVNDTYGHQAGDSVLCGVADLLREGPDGLRRSDMAARYGGEEFCVVLPETPLMGGCLKAERVCKSMAAKTWEGGPFPDDFQVTISLGVAAFPDHGQRADDLLRAADNALYAAKSAGKNRVEVAAPPASP